MALSLGDIAFVERPLYDYVQHGEATLGHAAANRMPGMRERVGALRRDPHERVRMWRMHYYVDACRLLQFAAVLRLRIGERMPPDKRRDLDRFERADRSLAPIAGLAWRGAQELLGRRRDTLGAEWMLFHAFAWRRMLAASARDRPTRRLRLDALPPPTLDPRPGARQPAEPAARAVAEKIAPLRLAERDDAPRRVNLLIPSIDLEHFFGGYIGKFNFARRLAARGVRVRIVTVDPVGSLPASWREDVEAYSGLAGLLGEVEVAFGRESQGLEVSRADTFVATTWWTAHIAHAALRTLDAQRFLYLIQEYEPFTFPMGTHAALAAESYRFPHAALFSTELLRDYFRRHGIGVYAAGRGRRPRLGVVRQRDHGDRPAERRRAGRPASAPAAVLRPAGAARRPQHVRARRAGAQPGARARRVRGRLDPARHRDGPRGAPAGPRRRRAAGAAPALAPGRVRAAAARARRRPRADVHPAPEPRAAGDGLGGAADGDQHVREQDGRGAGLDLLQPDRGRAGHRGVAAALCDAAAGADDVERRLRGSRVRWPRDWDESFGEPVLTRVLSLLEG